MKDDQGRSRSIQHPIACVDCHDPKTMALRVTRPGFIAGITALKAKQGIADYDPNRDATRQEMRSFVCGQCHVEYYFKGDEQGRDLPVGERPHASRRSRPTTTTEGFTDWTHAETGHQGAQGAAPGVRGVEPGRPRARGRGVRGLPHARTSASAR
mgnify:CR=1 FL=1